MFLLENVSIERLEKRHEGQNTVHVFKCKFPPLITTSPEEEQTIFTMKLCRCSAEGPHRTRPAP